MENNLNSANSAFSNGKGPLSTTSKALVNQMGICRICLEETDIKNLLSPCNCKGTAAYVHQICLEIWLKTSRVKTCETCKGEYEKVNKGLKPLMQLSLPRPTSDRWEDGADFYCTVLWIFLVGNVSSFWIRKGVFAFNTSLLSALNSRRLVMLWWFSFSVNCFYYFDIACQIYRRWIDDNSNFEWKANKHNIS
ncbi:RING-variant domain-containing protein [Ditylenchus destructor]|uniref:RING-variant domain-containing protein n=1 Tax=Ditylenchus destructor TaxID=166010 RepID=A0AAD4RD99_9BILA|nr:RING-variant domain-containing protein [Ditylenchus destructor]